MANRTLGSVTTIMKLNNSAFKKGLSNSKKDVNKFSSSMKGVGAAIGGAFAVQSILRFASESSKLAATMEGVAKAFDRIRPNVGFLDELKRATAGTVSELDLMRRAVMASNFKIPLTELATLLKFATKRAQETGESVSYLVNSIVIGIGRKSPLILDNLGISAVELRKKLEGVGHSGATVGQVAAAVGEIAAEAMAEMGDVIETTAIKYERMAASITDMKTEFGSLVNVIVVELLPPLIKVVGAMGDLATIVKKGIGGFKWEKNLEASNNAAAKAIEEAKKYIQFSAPLRAEQSGATDIAEMYNIIAERIKMATEAEAEFNKEGLTWAGYVQGEIRAGLIQWQKELEKGTEAAEASAGSLNMLKEELKLLKEMFANTGNIFKQLELALEINKVTDQIKKIEMIGKPHPEMVDYLEDLYKELEAIAKVGEKIKKAGGVQGYLYAYDEPEDIGLEMADKVIAAYEKSVARAKSLTDQMNAELSRMMADGLENLVGGMFEALTAGDLSGFDNFLNSILSIFGKFAQQMGAMLIAYGISMEAFKKAFTNPLAAIAAGVALVAIGGAMTGMAKRFNGGGGVNVSGGYADPRTGQVDYRISGNAIVGSYDNTMTRRNMLT